MKFISLLALGALLASCSSHKSATQTKTAKATKPTHHTWYEVVVRSKMETRAPASVKETEIKELLQNMTKVQGWKTVPVGKAITKEVTEAYNEGEATTVTIVESILKQNKSGYFVLSTSEGSAELEVLSLNGSAATVVEEMKPYLKSIKKTGATTYVLGLGAEEFNCELKLDLKVSSVFFLQSCTDNSGKIVSSEKVLGTTEINKEAARTHLTEIALSACPDELNGEEYNCITDEYKNDWSYLVK